MPVGSPATLPSTAATRWTDRAAALGLVWLLVVCWETGLLLVLFNLTDAFPPQAPTRWWAVALTTVAAVGTGVPMLRWLRPTVDALLFSHWDDAQDVIVDLGARLQAFPVERDGPDDLVEQIAAEVAGRLRLPYVAIATDDQPAAPPPAEVVADPARLVRVPLRFAGDTIGTLIVAPRTRERTLSTQDLTLLQELAAHIGIALHATRVSQDLQQSRVELISAREEERRRIRRDLHDGLGPTLASLRFQLAAIQQLIDREPERARELVTRLRGEVSATSAQVRTLVYDLRPSMLDDFGLLEAVRSRAAELHPLAVSVSTEEVPGDLPAAVEVALYRIAGEALTNVARHAAASRCRVEFTFTDTAATIRVTDDGRGLPTPLLPGVGLSAMQERAEELGGSLELATTPEGTQLTASFPRGTST